MARRPRPGPRCPSCSRSRAASATVTQVAYGVARGVQYASIALAVGTVFFLIFIWLPAALAGRRRRARNGARPPSGSRRGARTVLLLAVIAGVLSGARRHRVPGRHGRRRDVLVRARQPDHRGRASSTRFGTIWGIRILVWLGLGAVLLGTLSQRPAGRCCAPPRWAPPGSRPRGSAARPCCCSRFPLGYLVISPALSGHAHLEKPTAVLVPANAIHVLAMSVWVAGLAMLLFVLPRATRRLEPPDRTRLLAATLARFSPVAFAAVIALLATGLVQSWFEVEKLDNLLDTAFGRAALIKFGLLVGPLMALGAYNQRRLLPRLRHAAAGGATPGPRRLPAAPVDPHRGRAARGRAGRDRGARQLCALRQRLERAAVGDGVARPGRPPADGRPGARRARTRCTST